MPTSSLLPRPSTPSSTDSRTSILGLMGAPYLTIALVARLPFAMMVVGTLTLLVQVGRTVSEGGLVSAAAGIGTAVGAPLLGRAIERFGQRAVLLAVGPAFGVLLLTLTALAWFDAPIVALIASSWAAGVVSPQVAPMSRSRVVVAASRRGGSTLLLDKAMGHESMADEAAFVIGPVLVGVLSVTLGPYAPLLTAAVVTFSAVIAFALHPTALSSATARETAQPHERGVLLSARFLVLAAGMACIGALFGTTLPALTSRMAADGAADGTGLVYSVLSVGSILTAATVARIPQRVLPRRRRWTAAALLVTTGCALLLLPGSIAIICAGLLVSGCGLGIALVTLFSLTSEAVPESRHTTAFAIMSSALIVSQAVVTAAVGMMVDATGSATGFALDVAIGALLLLLATTYRRMPDAAPYRAASPRETP